MITYPISSNLYKRISLQRYRLYNFSSFRSPHWRSSVRKGVFKNVAKFTWKHLWQSLFCNKVEVSASDLSRVFSWRFCLFHFNRNEKREIPCWSWNIYFFARVSICLTSKTSKGNLMLQFSELVEFRSGKVSGWWTLDKLQYENGLKDQLQTFAHKFLTDCCTKPCPRFF